MSLCDSAINERGLLGASGGVVNSLDFCPAPLKSLGCFRFRCVLSSQWKAVTVNLRILHCQLERHFWRPVVRMCLATSNNMPPNAFFFFSPRTRDLLGRKRKKERERQKKTQRPFLSTLHLLFLVIVATATVVAFALLRNSRFNFHSYTQREATPTQKSARK